MRHIALGLVFYIIVIESFISRKNFRLSKNHIYSLESSELFARNLNRKPSHVQEISDKFDNLCDKTGNKKVLQELSQNLFNGSNPSYVWEKDMSLRVKISNYIDIEFSNFDSYPNMTNLERKKIEMSGARYAIDTLINDVQYNGLIENWISKRVNRDNVPFILRSLDVRKAASNKSLALLIDAENVPDFKRYFYTNQYGEIKFSSPLLPQVRQAPELATSDEKEYSQPAISLYYDDDMVVFAYAHTKSAQCTVANRRTIDSRKDAADAMIIFDLGSLQHCSSLQHILLVTGDGFGSSAAACFDSFSLRRPGSLYLETPGYWSCERTEISQHNPNILTKYLPLGRYQWMNGADRYGQPVFKWALTCADAATLLGRLPV